MVTEERLRELGITLPEATPPVAMYVPVRRSGSMLYVSGQMSKTVDGKILTGKLKSENDVAYGREAARCCAINILAALKSHLGDLDLIKSVVKLSVFVNCSDDFMLPHLVANGASELFFDVFGEQGKHARTTIGVNQLPLDTSVEVDAIVGV